MEVESLQGEDLRAACVLFAREIGRDLTNWILGQSDAGASFAPLDDPNWGMGALPSQPQAAQPMRTAPQPQAAQPMRTAPQPQAAQPMRTAPQPQAAQPMRPVPQAQAGQPMRTAPQPQAQSGGAGSCFSAFRAMRAQQSATANATQDRASSLRLLRAKACACRACSLGLRRRDVMWGYGPTDASVAFVAAGGNPAELDAKRLLPGDAGALLDKIIAAMAGIHPEARAERIYMTNVIKCACCPARAEMYECARRCLPHLRDEIRTVAPRLIIIWGELAYRTMMGSDAPLSQVRGRVERFEGIPAMATHHPIEMLRNPNLKARVWGDLQTALRLLGPRV